MLLDRCTRCGGLWLDGPEVAAVAPMVGSLESYRPWLLAQRTDPPAGISHCPACQGETVECPCYGVRLDVCLGCLGVWLDGGELDALRRNASPSAGTLQPSTARTAQCVGCGAVLALETTWMTSNGVMCPGCYARTPDGVQREPTRRLEARDVVDAAEAAVVTVEVLGGLMELLGAIFKVLE